MFKLLCEYKWIYQLFPKAKGIVIAIFMLQIVSNLLATILPLIFCLIIDSVFLKSDYILFVKYIILYSVIYFIRLLIMSVIEKANLKMTRNFTNELKLFFFKKAMSLKAEQLSTLSTGDVIYTINSSVEGVYTFLNTVILSSLLSYIYLAILFLVMVLICWEIAVTIFFFSWLVIFCSDIFKKRFTKLKKEYREKFGEYSSWIVEILNGMKDIRSNNAEKYISQSFGDYVRILLRCKEKARFVEIKAERLNAFFTILFTVAFWAVSAIFVIIRRITLGKFLALEKYFNMTIEKIDIIRNAKIEYHSYRPNFEKIAELFEMPSENLDEGTSIVLKKQPIILDHVSFQYNQDRPVLQSISAYIKPGCFVAVVGANGEGKSTLLGLLVKFYNPKSGNLCFGDYSITDLEPRGLREQIGYMQQDTIIFEGTLADNLRIYAPMVTEEEMCTALNKVGMLSTVLKWEKGLQTDLLKGARLSGGQKQRIALARLLIEDVSIILMDEPTSALDEETEEEIISDIKNIFVDKTVIMVSHRRKAVMKADHVFVLRQGKIVASGADRVLKNSCDVYNQLIYSSKEGEN